jgi:hypothetical protein
MIILAFDPGQSTGFCRVDFSRFYNRVESTTFATIQYDDLTDFINHNLGDVVLIERPPSVRQQGSIVHMAYERISFLVGSHEAIFPASWKPIANARNWKCLSAKTQHERDAYGIIRWYIFKTFSQDIGD